MYKMSSGVGGGGGHSCHPYKFGLILRKEVTNVPVSLSHTVHTAYHKFNHLMSEWVILENVDTHDRSTWNKRNNVCMHIIGYTHNCSKVVNRGLLLLLSRKSFYLENMLNGSCILYWYHRPAKVLNYRDKCSTDLPVLINDIILWVWLKLTSLGILLCNSFIAI